MQLAMREQKGGESRPSEYLCFVFAFVRRRPLFLFSFSLFAHYFPRFYNYAASSRQKKRGTSNLLGKGCALTVPGGLELFYYLPTFEPGPPLFLHGPPAADESVFSSPPPVGRLPSDRWRKWIDRKPLPDRGRPLERNSIFGRLQ